MGGAGVGGEAARIGIEWFEKGEVHTFQNATRETPIETRFPGDVRLAKLKALKREWDPEGVFANVFL